MPRPNFPPGGSTLCLVLFLAVTAGVLTASMEWFDAPAGRLVGHHPALERCADAVAVLASPPGSLVWVACLSYAVWLRYGAREAAVLLAAFAGSVVIELGIKALAGSYPSGHVARAALLATVTLGLLIPRAGILPLLLSLPVVAVVSWQRVAGDFHAGADVLGGALLGFALGLWVLSKLEPATPVARALPFPERSSSRNRGVASPRTGSKHH